VKKNELGGKGTDFPAHYQGYLPTYLLSRYFETSAYHPMVALMSVEFTRSDMALLS
jgi:hypothetical protein